MATELRNIEVTTLPLELNFQELKSQGISYIEDHSDTNWTNFNPSDPGITILEQLCFAYTELGYCGDFPMKDILTQKDGTLLIDEEFYLPQDILTTSPITVNDYRKILIDRLETVKNSYFITSKVLYSFLNGIYQAYLRQTTGATEDLLSSAYYELNTCRNLGEYFIAPKFLTSAIYKVSGTVIIDKKSDADDIYNEIYYQVNNYVFPDVTQTGYDNLILQGESINEIYEGPILKNGNISADGLFNKEDRVTSYEITEVIKSVSGVSSVSNVTFVIDDSSGANENQENESGEKTTSSKSTVSCDDNEIIVINIDELIIKYEGNDVAVEVSVSEEEQSEKKKKVGQIDEVSTINKTPKVPTGSYREIEDYYSIQNTFPETYQIGMGAVDYNASDFQIAQSRQLKGYLTLYDQLLANQLSQLANLGSLFSFKNSITGTPYDRDNYLAQLTEFEKTNQQYPAPFLSFSPTYYYQSLYDAVPDIRPLLKNYNAFRFTFDSTESDKELDKRSWEDYKQSPYNSYIWGLMYFMEKEDINLDRRNEILDHLLARHGESPLYIDTVINDTIYSGDVSKDQVIVKSLYLQNFKNLSYNRMKAYNFLGCSRLLGLDEMKERYLLLLDKLQQYVADYDASQSSTETEVEDFIEAKEAQALFVEYVGWNQSDFIFNVRQVDQREKVSEQNTIDYSGFELKLNIILSLNQHYQKYLLESPSQELIWMRYMRRGLLLIETNLLLSSAQFNEKDSEEVMDYQSFIVANGTTANQNISISWGTTNAEIDSTVFENPIILVFPEFLQDVDGFEERLDTFIENELPLGLGVTKLFASADDLNTIIPLYVNWHNAIRYQDPTISSSEENDKPSPQDLAGSLYSQLLNMISSNTSNE